MFQAYLALYFYDKTPLQAKVEGVIQTTADWREEKITYDTAYNGERMAAYLFVPKNGSWLFFPAAAYSQRCTTERTACGPWAALKKTGRAGRKPRLSTADLERIAQELKRGPEPLGYETSLWTAPRVADLIERECGIRYHPGHVWKILRHLG